MDLLKRLAGIFLIFLAVVLSLATLVSSINAISKSMDKIEESTLYGIGYVFGSLLAILIFVTIIYFIMKLGLKLIKKKTVEVESIDDIGV